MLTQDIKVKKVHGIEREWPEIKAYIQGAIYCWCKNKKGHEFYARDLVGGDNANWGDTPLQILYDRLVDDNTSEQGHKKAYEQAAKDLGKLFLMVIKADPRKFDTGSDLARWYKWIPEPES